MDAESETFVTHALTASAGQGATEDGTGRGCPLVAVAHSLSADGFDASEDGTGRGTPLVAVGFQETGQGYWMQHEVACGLRDMSAGSGAAIANVITQPVGSQENSSTTVAVTTLAIRGRGDESALEYRTDGTANALLTPNGGRAGIGVGAIQQAMAVRRLTPEECEALQGFRRGFTNIPGAADGPRYRSLGNSMAVPVMAWIGQRISETYAND